MPISSDASAFTSVTASPLDTQDSHEIPVELKIPLPSSSSCSDQDLEARIRTEVGADDPNSISVAVEEGKNEENGASLNNELSCAPKSEDMPEDGLLRNPPAVQELVQLVELEKYHRNRAQSIQAEVDQVSFSCGLNGRQINTASIAYCNMIDQYKSEDQASFAGLYEACEQLTDLCNLQAQSIGPKAVKPEDVDSSRSDLEWSSPVQSLPRNDQDCIISFLTRLRTDPEFLANLISDLSPSDLTALTSCYHPAGIDLSILPNHSHGRTSMYSRNSQMMNFSRRMDNLNRFHTQDPFFALLYGTFASSSEPGSREQSRRIDVWSTTCARVITDGKPGSEEFTIAAIDAFAGFEECNLKPKVELYLMQVLAKGAFILEPPTSQPIDFKEPIEARNANHAIAIANFFHESLRDLFAMLTSGPPRDNMPDSVLAFVHATLRKIQDSKTRVQAKKFIVSRWYFASFLSSILIYPEVQGILMTHHIDKSTRQVILKELVVRMQTQMFNVVSPWNNHFIVTPEVRDQVSTIFNYFEPSMENDLSPGYAPTEHLENTKDRTVASTMRLQNSEHPEQRIMLSHLDLVGLIEALYPEPSSEPGDQIGSTKAFAAPSTTRSSTLHPGSSDVSSVVASSIAPSCTGTSATSDTGISCIQAPRTGKAIIAQDQTYHGPVQTPRRLREICQKIKFTNRTGMSAGPEMLSLRETWHFFDILHDGSLSVHTGQDVFRAQDTFSSSQVRGSYSLDEAPEKYRELKASIASLMEEQQITQAGFLIDSWKQPSQDFLRGLLEAAVAEAQNRFDFRTAHHRWKCLTNYLDLLASRDTHFFDRVLLQDVANDLLASIATHNDQIENAQSSMRFLNFLQRRQQSVLAKYHQQRRSLRVKMWYTSDVRHSSTYEEAALVVNALRAMANPKRTKNPGSISNWARQRLRGLPTNHRAEVQTLEALSAPKEHGGPSKLADDQVELTSKWLTRNSIENFCKGEERIHRFCYEVNRSIGKFTGASLLESPVLWSSNLFKREKSVFDTSPSRSHAFGSLHTNLSTPLSSHDYSGDLSPSTGLRPPSRSTTISPSSPIGFWSTPKVRRDQIGLGLQDGTRNNSFVHWSGIGFGPWSPPLTPISPLPKSTSNEIFSVGRQGSAEAAGKELFLEDIRQSLSGLLTSDLGYLLCSHGSETDAWVNNASEAGFLGSPEHSEKAIDQHAPAVDSTIPPSDVTLPGSDVPSVTTIPLTPLQPASEPQPHRTHKSEFQIKFPFRVAYKTLLQRMSLSPNPYTKLERLCELESLVLSSIDDSSIARRPSRFKPDSGLRQSQQMDAYARNRSVPRTKATSLEEVVANCTERRASTLRYKTPQRNARPPDISSASWESPGTDAIVEALLSIFHDPELRPPTLFRDLQYIAAFIPPSILDKTAQGKAFWDAGLAGLALKEELCNETMTRAQEITTYNVSTKKPPEHPSESAVPTYLASTTLGEAANLWLIAAKEGSAVAAREVGLFYLTNPDLLPAITMPFSKGRDVFRAIGVGERTGDKERGALDPVTFAIVYHWMDVAANGGDREAREFLKGTGELSGGR